MDSMVNKGLKEYTRLLQHSFNTPSTLLQHEFSTQSQNFDHMKEKDTRLCQILVNHQIATSPESSQT